MKKESFNQNKFVIVKKFLWTALFIAIYIIGSHIPVIAHVQDKVTISRDSFNSIWDLTDGGITGNLFSIGITPMMSGSLIWNAVTVSNIIDARKLTKTMNDRIQAFLIFIIAFIQDLSMTLSWFGLSNVYQVTNWLEFSSVVLFLIAGAFFLVFLSYQNAVLGVGGSFLFMLIGMLMNSFNKLIHFFMGSNQVSLILLAIIILYTIIILYSSVIMYKAQREIIVHRIALSQEFFGKAYIPIKLNSSGGMAFMYVTSFLSLLQYVAIFFVPKGVSAQLFSLQSASGVFIYCCLLGGLSLGLCFVNVNPLDMAKALRNSGDYIPNVYPGKPTQAYLKKVIFELGFVGSVYTVIVAGLPLVIGLWLPQMFDLMMIPGTMMMLSGMTLTVSEQVFVWRIGQQYQSLFNE